jgi:hypothetical protein
MQFDENGFLTPYEPIETDLKKFQDIFTFNLHREELFKNYLNLLDAFKTLPLTNYYQWVDGSFATLKPYPRDIDLVNFVNAHQYRQFESKLIYLAKIFKDKGLDMYWIAIYPKNDFKNAITTYTTYEFQELYGTDRLNRKKGFLQIKF